jgi:integrase
MKVYLLERKSTISKQSQQTGRVKKTTLFLAYHYGPGQKREYENLKLFIYEQPKTQLERDHNKETWTLAETIKARKILDAQSTAHGFVSSIRGKMCFLQFFKKLVDKKYDTIGNYGNWKSTYQHLLEFTNNKSLPMDKVDDRFLESFKEYLLSCKTIKGHRKEKLNRNSAMSYFNKVRAALREAYNAKMIKENPATRVKCIKGQEVNRAFLTMEELQKLAITPCDDPLLGKAFLFAAITGLRFSDVKALKWANIKYSEQDGYFINYTQKKTKKAEILPVAAHSLQILGKRGAEEVNVFEGLTYSAWKNKLLQAWIKSAGINKKISFHCSRHTQAVLQLSLGTDIFTLSKLLGHANIKTTMHYAHIIDQHKIDAANKIPQLLAS